MRQAGHLESIKRAKIIRWTVNKAFAGRLVCIRYTFDCHVLRLFYKSDPNHHQAKRNASTSDPYGLSSISFDQHTRTRSSNRDHAILKDEKLFLAYQRMMVGIGGRSKGCETCSKRRIKCGKQTSLVTPRGGELILSEQMRVDQHAFDAAKQNYHVQATKT